jgi:2-succinyl-5-enolpyruvyl-6-hydroxy-3-cyclohexene-1-carboxylate synthase
MVFEVFTDSNQESIALERILSIDVDKKVKTKQVVKSMIGNSTISGLKKMIGK